MDRANIDKIAQNYEERVLLAKIWDKITAGMQRSIPANTAFLNPRELSLAKFLFGQQNGLFVFGGYPDSERNMLVYIPEYLDEDYLFGEDSPIVCIHADFYERDTLSHRDFLGGLLACGIARETIGDICVGKSCCDILVTAEIAPFLLQNFLSAGRVSLRLSTVPLADISIQEPEIREIRDTLASVRLDSVIASGFSIGRSLAAQYISAGKSLVDGLLCEKPDKVVVEGTKISVRSLGKIKLQKINGLTKKGRISVVIHRYV